MKAAILDNTALPDHHIVNCTLQYSTFGQSHRGDGRPTASILSIRLGRWFSARFFLKLIDSPYETYGVAPRSISFNDDKALWTNLTQWGDHLLYGSGPTPTVRNMIIWQYRIIQDGSLLLNMDEEGF